MDTPFLLGSHCRSFNTNGVCIQEKKKTQGRQGRPKNCFFIIKQTNM